MDFNDITEGEIYKHKLGIDVLVLKKLTHIRGKGDKQKTTHTLKCRHLDGDFMFHVYEFYPNELI